MSQALRKLTGAISRTGCTVIFINQIRMKIGVMFGNPETTTGGNALKFYASVRMDIRRKAKLETGTGDNKEAIGNEVEVKVVKNKVAPPFRAAHFDILFAHGISKEGEIIELGVKLGIINKSGAFLSFGDTKLGQGKENARKFLIENPEVASVIEQKIRNEKEDALIDIENSNDETLDEK